MPEGQGGEQAEAGELVNLEAGPELEQHVQGAPHSRHLVLEEAAVEGKHAMQHLTAKN